MSRSFRFPCLAFARRALATLGGCAFGITALLLTTPPALAGCNSGNTGNDAIVTSSDCQASAHANFSTAVGTGASADQSEATAYGDHAAAGSGATAVGTSATATDAAIAFGDAAFGDHATAGGDATSVGAHANAAKDGTAIGAAASASVFGVALGVASSAGAAATALGQEAVAAGNQAIAVGSGAGAHYDNVITVGSGAAAQGPDATLVGRANLSDSFGTAIGSGAIASTGATSLGAATRAYGNYSIAIGGSDTTTLPGALAGGLRAIAIGQDSSASATNAIAFGYATKAVQSGAVAIGSGAVAHTATSVALGSGSVATVANTVSVGTTSSQRRIMNVAAAVNDTDAVNLAQVQALIAAPRMARAPAQFVALPEQQTPLSKGARRQPSLGAQLANVGGSSRASASAQATTEEEGEQPSIVVGWAKVQADGTLTGARNIISNLRRGIGKYEIGFKHGSLAQCVYNATLHDSGLISVNEASKPNSLIVQTRNHLGVPADLAFHITATC